MATWANPVPVPKEPTKVRVIRESGFHRNGGDLLI